MTILRDFLMVIARVTIALGVQQLRELEWSLFRQIVALFLNYNVNGTSKCYNVTLSACVTHAPLSRRLRGRSRGGGLLLFVKLFSNLGQAKPKKLVESFVLFYALYSQLIDFIILS